MVPPWSPSPIIHPHGFGSACSLAPLASASSPLNPVVPPLSPRFLPGPTSVPKAPAWPQLCPHGSSPCDSVLHPWSLWLQPGPSHAHSLVLTTSTQHPVPLCLFFCPHGSVPWLSPSCPCPCPSPSPVPELFLSPSLSAALLKLAEMQYTGANSIFLRLLIDKKYALPFRVLDALVFHFLAFRTDQRLLPVLWHQSLLALAQRYKEDLSSEQKEALLELLKFHSHPQISPEIRRELMNSKTRDVEGEQAVTME